MYYTSEDFERFYLKYTSEGMTANETMQSFCDRNKVPFNLFHKWYKDTRVRVGPVQVEDKPNSKIGWKNELFVFNDFILILREYYRTLELRP